MNNIPILSCIFVFRNYARNFYITLLDSCYITPDKIFQLAMSRTCYTVEIIRKCRCYLRASSSLIQISHTFYAGHFHFVPDYEACFFRLLIDVIDSSILNLEDNTHQWIRNILQEYYFTVKPGLNVSCNFRFPKLSILDFIKLFPSIMKRKYNCSLFNINISKL